MSTDIDPLDYSTFLDLAKEAFLLDIRRPEEFAKLHLARSLNIPLTPSFPHWTTCFIPKNEKILIIAHDNDQAHLAIYELHNMGFHKIAGFFEWNNSLAKNTELPLASLPLVDLRNAPSKYYLLDVRTMDEWNAGHIQRAHHLELQNFPMQMNRVPKNECIALICASGNRSSIGASILLKNGWSKVANVQGGMQTLSNSQLPISYL